MVEEDIVRIEIPNPKQQIPNKHQIQMIQLPKL
jgi:hypothetical protein